MPYFYLDDIATADVAFEAWGETKEEMFIAAAEASMNVMVEDLNTIDAYENKRFHFASESIEMLLFDLLQELIYFKDAEQLLIRIHKVSILKIDGHFVLNADAYGETIDPRKHELNADVKAVTLHRYRVEESEKGWRASVVLDI